MRGIRRQQSDVRLLMGGGRTKFRPRNVTISLLIKNGAGYFTEDKRMIALDPLLGLIPDIALSLPLHFGVLVTPRRLCWAAGVQSMEPHSDGNAEGKGVISTLSPLEPPPPPGP